MNQRFEKYFSTFWIECALWLILFLTLCFGVWAAAIGWNHYIMDEHSFRQAQTAITAYFLRKGGPFFAYETPLLGAPWSIPFELPVYQWFVAKWSLLTGMALEQSGRVIGKFFFYLTGIPLWIILKHFQISKSGRLVTLVLFFLSPMYLYWSRTFLIETTAVFFSASFLALALNALSGEQIKPSFLFITALFGSMATTIKITTAFAFFIFAGFYFLFKHKDFLRGRSFSSRALIEIFGIFLVPTVLGLLWVKYSDAQKALNPVADFIRSENLTKWNFGTWKQRASGSFFYMIFRQVIHDSIGHRTTWILSLFFVPFLSPTNRKLAIAFSLSFLLVPLTFTNLHIVHNYYWMANGIFLVLYLGVVIAGALEIRRLAPLAFLLLLFAISQEIRHYMRFGYYWQLNNNRGFEDLEKPLEFMNEKDAVVILGADWYPPVAYGTKKHALMVRPDTAVGSERFAQALERIQSTGAKIAAIVYCPNWAEKSDVLEKIKPLIPYQPKPYYSGSCIIYKTMI